VKSKTEDAQPGSPAEGDRYIITATATGSPWSTFNENDVATFLSGAWTAQAPVGRQALIVDDETDKLWGWTGSAWSALTGTGIQDVVDDTTPELGGPLDGLGQDLLNMGVLFLTEQAAAESDVTGKGQIWVKTGSPNELWFTNAAGSHFRLGIDPTKYIGQNLQTGTTYELVLSDAGKIVEMNDASANTLTIPANSAVVFPVDTRIDIIQYGAGQTTIDITTDTLRGNTKIPGQYQMVSLWKRTATEWVVIGGIA
jgi:hypothetical protein